MTLLKWLLHLKAHSDLRNLLRKMQWDREFSIWAHFTYTTAFYAVHVNEQTVENLKHSKFGSFKLVRLLVFHIDVNRVFENKKIFSFDVNFNKLSKS